MKCIAAILSLIHLSSFSVYAADPPAAFVEAALALRKEIPLGGDFKPDPKLPVFVAVGHGGRILLSLDDGQNWKQVFWGFAGSDHSPWATKAIAYTNGVFVVSIGWGAPSTWLASEDGVNWRQLTMARHSSRASKGLTLIRRSCPARGALQGVTASLSRVAI